MTKNNTISANLQKVYLVVEQSYRTVCYERLDAFLNI